MKRILFFGLGHLSNGDISIAADFARQLPAGEYEVGFVTAPSAAAYVRELGLTVYPLGDVPERNLELTDQLVADFRPDLLVAADAFTLDYSTGWSGLSMSVLRHRYPVPLASFDQYDYPAADYMVDFYSGHRARFPRLLTKCDLLIRNSPLNRPAPGEPGVIVTPMECRGWSPLPVRRARPDKPPTVLLVNSRWEDVNVVRSPPMSELMAAMPRVIHSHLAALGRPLRVVHVGPRRWDFPVADQIDYRHVEKLSPPEFHARLAGADLFLTGNVVSVTLTQAVYSGVPSLVLRNPKTLDVGRLVRDGSAPAWLADAAPGLSVAYPFRVFPWGWYEFLSPVLTDNPYVDCFHTAGMFERRRVLESLGALLDDATSRGVLRDRQDTLRRRLAQLPRPGEALGAALAAL
ncbi:DUF6365 family protein [Longispora sp. K20-0274]|uniref:DUF6365 family protein n=1 Tax=Longispora sp. K20-0274 TaxID=3088255 RepID=UPI00399BD559